MISQVSRRGLEAAATRVLEHTFLYFRKGRSEISSFLINPAFPSFFSGPCPHRDVPPREPPIPVRARRGVHFRGAHPHLHQPLQVESCSLLGIGDDPPPHASQGAPGPPPLQGRGRLIRGLHQRRI